MRGRLRLRPGPLCRCPLDRTAPGGGAAMPNLGGIDMSSPQAQQMIQAIQQNPEMLQTVLAQVPFHFFTNVF